MVVGVACVLILPAFTLLSYSSIKFINYVDSIVSVKLGVIGHFVLITFHISLCCENVNLSGKSVQRRVFLVLYI